MSETLVMDTAARERGITPEYREAVRVHRSRPRAGRVRRAVLAWNTDRRGIVAAVTFVSAAAGLLARLAALPQVDALLQRIFKIGSAPEVDTAKHGA